jgi:hypothetical protein
MRVRFQLGPSAKTDAKPDEVAVRILAALYEIKAWEEGKIRRHPKGTRRGGRFVPKASGRWRIAPRLNDDSAPFAGTRIHLTRLYLPQRVAVTVGEMMEGDSPF